MKLAVLLARRSFMGLTRLGSFAGNQSGDIIVSFSTTGAANDPEEEKPANMVLFPNGLIDPLFQATVEATEESITNALVAALEMTGIDGYRCMPGPTTR